MKFTLPFSVSILLSLLIGMLNPPEETLLVNGTTQRSNPHVVNATKGTFPASPRRPSPFITEPVTSSVITQGTATLLAPAVTAIKTAVLVGTDNGTAGPTPGDVIEYTVTIANTGPDDATAVNFTDTVDPNTTLVPGSVKSAPIAVKDAYSTVGNVSISVPAASGLTSNDVNLDAGDVISVTAVNQTGTEGQVTFNANGSFTFNPNPGFTGATTFTYTISDGTFTSTNTVTITMTGMIWFINASAPAGGDGRLSTPWNSMNAFNATSLDDPGDNIFVYTGTYTNTLSTILLGQQKLIGQGAAGASLAALAGVTFSTHPPISPATIPTVGGTRPTINQGANNINMQSQNQVRGVNINNTGGTSLLGSGFTSALVREVSITNTGGTGVNFNNGALDVIIQSISASNNSTGIFVSQTTGSFEVTGTGTTDASGGTLTNISGRGIEIRNATNITLRNMSLPSANSVSDAGFDTQCDEDDVAACFAAIYMNIVNTVAFHNIDIGATKEHGIVGLNVSNLTMDNCTATGNGDAPSEDENALKFRNLSGTCSITNSTFQTSAVRTFHLINNTGSLNLTVNNCTFNDPTGADCFEARTQSSATATINLTNSLFQRAGTKGIQVIAEGSSTMNININNCKVQRFGTPMAGIEVGSVGTATINSNIINCTDIESSQEVAVLGSTFNTSTFNARLNNNTNIGHNAGAATAFSTIRMLHEQNSLAKYEIRSNSNISLVNGEATIQGIARIATTTAGRLDFFVDGNNITRDAASLEGIELRMGGTGVANDEFNILCSDVLNNNVTGASGLRALRVRDLDPTSGDLRLQGDDGPNVPTYWTDRSNTNTAGMTQTEAGTPAYFVSTATCLTPGHSAARIAAEPLAIIEKDRPEVEVAQVREEVKNEPDALTTIPGPSKATNEVEEAARRAVVLSGETVTVGGVGGFLLPAGQNIIIKFQVSIDTPLPAGVCQISNQGTVSGSNFTTIQTDDVAGSPVNPTLTPLSKHSLGNLVYRDNNKNNSFDGGDVGINGVVVNLYQDNGSIPGVLDGTDAFVSTTTTAGGGLYLFSNLCSGDYIVQIPSAEFGTGEPLNGLISSPGGAAPDPDNNTDNDDNGQDAIGSSIASQAITLNYSTSFVENNTTLDFGFKTPTLVTINDVTMSEGSGGTTTFTFTVSRDNTLDAFALTVNTGVISLNNGDYTAISGGTVNFTVGGSSTALIDVTVNADETVEANESFNVLLSGAPDGIIISDGTGLGTITNDDQAVLSINSVSNAEGNAGTQTYTFTVTSDKAVDVPFTVNAVTANGTATIADNDYVANSTTLNFTGTAGETKTFNVVVNGDLKVEPNETFTVPLSSVVASGRNVVISGPSGTGTGTITNDDAATISINDVALAEGNAGTTTFTFNVTLSQVVSSAVTVDFATANGTANAGGDYTPNSGTLTFPANGAGQTQTITVQVIGDAVGEANETFFVNLTNILGSPSVNLSDAQGLGTILDDDLSFSINDMTVAEGNAGTTNFTFTVTRTGTATAETIDFATANNTATTADNDYVLNSGTLNFAVGDNSETITVVINADQKVELNESFFVNLSNASNGSIADAQGVGTITNDDQATLSINSVTNAEGNAGTQTYTFTVTSDKAVDVPFTVNAVTANGTATTGDNDYAVNNATLNFVGTAGETQTFNVTVNGDLKVEPNETFTVPLSSVVASGRNVVISGPSGTGTGTITNDDAATISINDVTQVEGNAGTITFTFNVTLSQVVSSAVTVDFATANGTANAGGDYTPNSGTLTFPANGAGQTQTVSVSVLGDVVGEANETFFVNLTNIMGAANVTFADNQGLGTIQDDDLSFSISDATILEGNSGTTTLTFTVTRNSTATAETIDYQTADNTATTADNDYVAKNGTLTFAVGDASEDIVITLNGDLKVEPNETFFVNLSNLSNGSISDGQGQGTITNDDAAVVTLSGGTAKNEGAAGTTSYTFTATLNNPVQGGLSVAYTTTNGTASTADNDYTDNDGTLTFTGTSGEQKTITVLVNGDNKVELDEAFTVALGAITLAPVEVTTAGSPQTGTITNDDAATVALVGNVSQSEAITPQVFSVSLSNPVDVAVTVNFSTTDGTATTADNDYTGITNQVVTFAAGTTTAQTVNVTVVNDAKVEANEGFNVGLSSLVASGRNVILGTSTGTGTIQNDDAATVTLSIPSTPYLQNEGNSGTTAYVFTATLNNPVQGGFQVAYTTNDGLAIAPEDYTDNDGSLSFAGTAGEMKTITVLVNGDLKVEANEDFTVALGAITGAPGGVTVVGSPKQAVITNDELDFGDAPDTYNTLLGNNGARHNTSIAFHLGATVDGDVDGQPTPTGNGDDIDAEGDDDDGVTLPSAFITGTTANITVNASGAGFLNAWVDFNNDGDFGDMGEQVFTNQALATGDNNLTIAVPSGAVPALTFARFRYTTATVMTPSFVGLQTTGEVEDYQVNILNTQFSVSSPTVAEGNASTTSLTFVISRTNNANAASVDYAITGGTASSGTDYVALASGTANFTAGGALTQNVTVTVNGDLMVEDNETVILTLSNPVGGGISTATGTGSITNDDAATLTLSGGTAKNEGAAGTTSYTFTATLNNPVQGGFGAPYTTTNGTATVADNDYVDNDGNLSFAGTSGEQKTITVLVNGDNKVELDETFTVALGALTGLTPVQLAAITTAGSPQTGTITNDDAATVALVGNISELESTTPQTFSVSLSNPVDANVTVNFSTSDSTATTADNDYTGITNQTVTFMAGSTSAQTVNVSITNDTKVEINEVYKVALTNLAASGRNVILGTSKGRGNIQNDDGATLTLSGGTSKAEGNSGTTSFIFTATLNNAVQGGFSVAYTTNDSTATVADNDYTDNDGTLTFVGTAGEAKDITVLVKGDSKVEANEAFKVILGALSGTVLDASIARKDTIQIGGITNDEIDFGDAPASYGTLTANNGARHATLLGMYLGTAIDGDEDGQPTATANGDDTDTDGDDEDGVTFPNFLLTGTSTSVTVTASVAGKLDAWIDFNQDGDFDDIGERIANTLSLTAGNNQVNFSVPVGSPDGNAPARFRFSSAGGLNATGLAPDGEVEDYVAAVINTLRIYVNAANVNPSQDGSTWAKAFSNLQSGLNAAATSMFPDIEIWVAQGTYKPGTLRSDVFKIPSKVRVYGGFVGTEINLSERNWVTHPVILSGEIGTIQRNDNSYHVVLFKSTDSLTRLDGFRIERGFAEFVAGTQNINVPDLLASGGGILAIEKSKGLITNCVITDNRAIGGGGMLLRDSSQLAITKTIIYGNEATFGGGVYVLGGSKPYFENVLMVINKGLGGGMYVNGSQPSLMNCTIASNKDDGNNAGGIFNANSLTTVKNSILWGNTAPQSTTGSVITYSTVEGGFSGVGNSNLNPLFVNANPVGLAPLGTLGDYHLQICSPAINGGDNAGAPNEDLEGNVRPFPVGLGIVDRGVFESQSSGSSGPANLTVTEPITSGTVLKVADKIVATNQVSGATVVYQAGKSVTLLPGFTATVGEGNSFQALIGGCDK